MKSFRKTLGVVARKSVLGLLIILGLLTIVGTGRDDKSDSGSSSTAPVAKIDTPSDNTIFQQNNSITFTGSATDSGGHALKGTALNWVSSLDGRIGSGTNFTVSTLSRGTHMITMTAIDTSGNANSASITVTVNPPGNTLPVATITNPSTGTSWNSGDYIEFTGTGYDTEDTWLTGPSLVWYSSKDGQIGTGNSVITNHLSEGTHTISLTVTDSQDTSNTASITVTIKNTPPIATINYPADGSTFSLSQSIPFDGSATDSEDGNLTGYNLVWTASNYGVIGYGSNITVDFLPVGTDIVINLRAIDSGGLSDSDSITITITP
jgi:hypothetical protein